MNVVGVVVSIAVLSSMAVGACISDCTAPTNFGDDIGLGDAGTASVGEMVVTPANMTVAPGATVTLVAAVRDTEGQAMSGRGVTWTSSDPTVAGISPSGVLIGEKEGKATITAISAGKAASVVLTVGIGTSAPVPDPSPTPSGKIVQDGF